MWRGWSSSNAAAPSPFYSSSLHLLPLAITPLFLFLLSSASFIPLSLSARTQVWKACPQSAAIDFCSTQLRMRKSNFPTLPVLFILSLVGSYGCAIPTGVLKLISTLHTIKELHSRRVLDIFTPGCAHSRQCSQPGRPQLKLSPLI